MTGPGGADDLSLVDAGVDVDRLEGLGVWASGTTDAHRILVLLDRVASGWHVQRAALRVAGDDADLDVGGRLAGGSSRPGARPRKRRHSSCRSRCAWTR